MNVEYHAYVGGTSFRDDMKALEYDGGMGIMIGCTGG
jgi:hypothetical protein